MRDWRKIILIASITFSVFIILGVLAYLLFSYLTKEERPPLDVPHAKIFNYKGDFDQINLPEYGVNFKIQAGGEINKSKESYKIKGDDYSLDLQIIPFNTLVLKTEDSLKKYESESLKYTQKDDIVLRDDYQEVYGKKRGDLIFTKNNELIRVLKDYTFKDNNTAIGSFEVLKGDNKELYKIFITYFGKKEQEKIKNKYPLEDKHYEKGLDYHKYFSLLKQDKFDMDIFGFGGVYNKPKTDELVDKILAKTNSDFKEKYGVDLEKEELVHYINLIKEDKNRYFNVIQFKRIILENNNIYLFTYEAYGENLNLERVFDNNFDYFFFKDIEITEAEKSLSGKQDIFDNMQFIIPSNYSKIESVGYNNNKFVLSPSVKKYNKGNITVKINKKEDRKETIDEVYKKNISKYMTESLSISNKSIVDVELVKSDKISLGGFEGLGNIFKFKTVNGNDFIYTEYIIFNNNMYYTITFAYGENEKELKPYFNDFVKSIKKIK